MSRLATAARVVLGAPGIVNADGELRLTVPVRNVGDTSLAGLAVRAVTLGGAVRTSPAAFPLVLGLLEAGGVATIAVRFRDPALLPGTRCLLSLTVSHFVHGAGHRAAGRQVHSLVLNRCVQIPPPTCAAAATLHARVRTERAAGSWRYTLYNDEAADSGLYLSALALMVSAPVAILGTPPGWRGETDGYSYVFWRAADYLPPYPNHLMPGDVLEGFVLGSPRTAAQASAAALASWNHSADTAGPVLAGDVLTPY
ncbi:hypothetical protein IP91_04540 [Pseudoduganella lurida]|uniref:Uncharacterized protein n=1 Tax=Pseudoduganella lurida TaxID=1036180 RepID=A0A562QZ26_9BURK|nr:hypothetical protein [Pseudoduganella lurida]TWI61460.1 hypothetical protein IP91_04540 [Pseudoduganella lurida]